MICAVYNLPYWWLVVSDLRSSEAQDFDVISVENIQLYQNLCLKVTLFVIDKIEA